MNTRKMNAVQRAIAEKASGRTELRRAERKAIMMILRSKQPASFSQVVEVFRWFKQADHRDRNWLRYLETTGRWEKANKEIIKCAITLLPDIFRPYT